MKILKFILKCTGSQWREAKKGETCSHLSAPVQKTNYSVQYSELAANGRAEPG